VTVGRLIRRSGPIFRPPCDSPRQALGAVPTSRPRQTPSPTPSSRQSRPLELGASSAAESGHQPPDDSTTPTVHRPVAAARPRPRWSSVVPSWRRLRRSVAACRRPPLAAKPRRIGRRPARRCRRPNRTTCHTMGVNSLPSESKKTIQYTILLPVTSPIVNRFWKFFC